MAEPSDEILVARYVKGDRSVLRVLIDRHKHDMLRFLTRLTGSQDAAEDAFQDTFLQFHLAAHKFDTKRRFKPWIFTIAANKARDAMRKKGRRPALGLSAPVGGNGNGAPIEFVDLMEISGPRPDEALQEREQQEMVSQAMDSLTYTLREVLLLAYFQKLSYAQIADDLDIPLGTVKSRLHSAVASFAKRYQELYLVRNPSVSTHASGEAPE
ncbi:MAG: RNA polymerase subunit sigma-70 [Phycisphaera sp.]|nr:MAG: RNA polymerase subunit sigma-70 [Phycisphaera sp.]